jgi:DNA-binding NarL/FixJ family response regulator
LSKSSCLLGHASLQTTERYLGIKQDFVHAPNDAIQLSSREIEVLRLIVQGSGNKQIAHSLHIAEDTAKNHVKSILRKLGAADRTEAATMAIRRGIVHLQV